MVNVNKTVKQMWCDRGFLPLLHSHFGGSIRSYEFYGTVEIQTHRAGTGMEV